MLKHIKM